VAWRAWLASAGLCAGVVGGGPTTIAIALIACGAGLLAVRRRPAVLIAGLVAVAAGSGIAATGDGGSEALPSLAERVPHCELDGRVLEQIGGLGTLVAVRYLRCRDATMDGGGELVLDIPTADAGARVRAEGWVVPLSDDAFDVARLRAGADAAFDAHDVEIGEVAGPLHRIAASFRSALRSSTRGLERDRAALVRGLTIGDTTAMTSRDEELLRRAGLSHLVAVSGSNVALVLGAVLVAARALRRRVRIGLAAAALALFVLTVGPEPSVLRAAVMGGIALMALGAGMRTDPLAALGMAVLAVVATRPGMVYSVGLHLSVAATTGLILWARPIASAVPRVPRIVGLGLGATLAAGTAVAPITAAVFGQVSLGSPLANLLAMPAVAPATIAGIGAALTELVGMPGAGLAAEVGGWCSAWILTVGRNIGDQAWSSIDVPAWMGAVLAAPVIAAAVARTVRG
jgi:competence protein ComEC